MIELLKEGNYANLNWTVGKALAQRNPGLDLISTVNRSTNLCSSHPGVYTCSLSDGLDTIFDTIRKSRVHRLTVVDDHGVLKGCISLSDILQFLLVEGPEGMD